MNDLSARLQEALGRIEPSWDDARSERALKGLRKKRRRRTAMRATAAAAAIAAVAGGAWAWNRASGHHEQIARPTMVQPAPEQPRLAPENPDDIVIHDGFVVAPDATAKVAVDRSHAGAVRVNVVAGKSRFHVRAPEAASGVEVHAGKLAVTVYSSEFSVARYAEVSEVWSHSGTVEVLWQGKKVVVAEGEHRRFDPAAAPAGDDSDTTDDDSSAEQPAAPAPVHHPRHQATDWRPLAREGKYDDAYRLLSRGHLGAGTADLMLAADVFRLSGHPADAVAPLQEVIDRHADDPRAPLAAFTLARVLLDDLGRPTAAARAFARARALDPDGALAEDALAREVEAWAKAGQAQRARSRAELYLERHPNGHRAHAVRQYGGL